MKHAVRNLKNIFGNNMTTSNERPTPTIKVDFKTQDEWKTFGLREKLKWLRYVFHENVGNIKGMISDNLTDLFDVLHSASSRGTIYRKLVDLGQITMSSHKFLSTVENVLTKETRIASNQYDYILKWVHCTSVDDLFINDVVINSDIIRAFAENIKKISESGAFKIKKMEYDPKTKSGGHDVSVNYLLEYTGEVECGVGMEVFMHCSYFNTADTSGKDVNLPSKGSFLVAINMTGDNIQYIDKLETDGDGLFDIYRSMLMVALQTYVNSLDVSSNVVKLDPYGDIRATSRRIVPFNINNFNMESIVSEMKKSLQYGRRRGYMFMGDPGTGKTESIQKLLEQFTDLPVFWVDSSSLSSYTAIHEVFKTLHYFPKSICVFDDVDALDLTSKSDKTTAFIECMDCKDDNLSYNGIVIMTVNEPTRVHSSIKSRPGRIDKIIYIKNPDELSIVYDVIIQRYIKADRPMPSEFSMTNEKFVKCMKECIKANFTHAHIAGIIDDIIYLSDTIGEQLIEELSMRIDDRINSIKYANMKTKNGYFEKSVVSED
jgi:hypothetical protein